MKVDELNILLCKALRIDPDRVRKITLTIEVGHWPTVDIERFTEDGDIETLSKTIESVKTSPNDKD